MPNLPSFLGDSRLELLLFGGKGGVGKTTCATATALALARCSTRKRFLLVSTDPAHSLADILDEAAHPANLQVLELDSRECLAAFRATHGRKLREIASRGTFLDEEDIAGFLDLSLPGQDELMAFLEISAWVQDRVYDCIVVDTAPTGHTLRLLGMPHLIRGWILFLDTLLAKHRYMKTVFGGCYRGDELDGFLHWLTASVERMESLLRDAARCRFVPVMGAEPLSVDETVSLLAELARLQLPVTEVVVNGLYPTNGCSLCSSTRIRQVQELAGLFRNSRLSGYTFWGVRLFPFEVRGGMALQAFWSEVVRIAPEPAPVKPRWTVPPRVEGPAAPPPPEAKLLLFAGKGGVGKTTLACATALRLSQEYPRKQVSLISVDPAHSLSACLDRRVGPEPLRLGPRLTVTEVDAQRELEALKALYAAEFQRFLESLSSNLDLPFDREVLERLLDLSPPGLDEVMALASVMKLLEEGSSGVLVLDPAPTGHLIRFLELPELIDRWLKLLFRLLLKYRQVLPLPMVSQRLVEMSKDLKKLRKLLADPARAALYAVGIPTKLSLEETKDLLAVCERMGIHVPALLLNLATPPSPCSLCSSLYRREALVREEFHRTFPGRPQTVVYRQGDLRGWQELAKLGDALYQPVAAESISYA
jgi:arsenite-transporting ATPase